MTSQHRSDPPKVSVDGFNGDHFNHEPETEGYNTMSYDTGKMSFVKGFEPKNLQLIFDKGRTLICAFENNYKGRTDYNIRELYMEYGEWCPGKGISVPMEKRDELLKGLVALAEHYLS